MSKKEKLDPQTAEILREGKLAKDAVESDAWKLVRKALMTRAINLSSIEDIDDTIDPMALASKLKANKMAINMIVGAINEIEGQASQYEMNKQMFQQERRDTIIMQLDV